MKRCLLPVCLVACVVFSAAGCSSKTQSDAIALSKAGQLASAQMKQAVSLSQDGTMRQFVAAQAFLDGYNGRQGNTDSSDTRNNVARLIEWHQKFERMLGSLASLYADLGDLASYDASGQVKAGIDNLRTNIDAWLAVVKPGKTVPETVGDHSGTAGGFVAGMVQAHMIKKYSKQIRGALDAVIAVMSDSEVRKGLIDDSRKYQGVVGQAVLVLRNKGVYPYSSVVDVISAGQDIKTGSASEAAIQKSQEVLSGLRYTNTELEEVRLAGLATTYEANLASLKALSRLHAEVEHGAPLNVQALMAALPTTK